MKLPLDCPVPYKKEVCLSRHTTFGIGGCAQFWAEPEDAAALAELLRWCKNRSLPVRVIGAGSNILVADRGVKGFVVKLSSPYFCKITRLGNRVLAGAGVGLGRLITFCTGQGLSGVEFLQGIPGTVGGALVGNAGTATQAIGDLVEFVVVMDYNGWVSNVPAANIDFSYRRSSIKNVIVLQACLKLSRQNIASIQRRLSAYARRRAGTQETGRRSAGCCFKNPDGFSAGRLIDACGLKGSRSGAAVVSQRHANFIINESGASAADVLRLMRHIARSVKRKFGIQLTPEIQIWQ